MSFSAMTIAEGIVWCGMLGMKCNGAALAFLPVFGLVVGLPIAYAMGLLVMPLALRLQRSDRLTRGVVLIVAAGLTIVFGGVVVPLAVLPNTTPTSVNWLTAYIAAISYGVVMAGPAIFISALVFHRLAIQRASPLGRAPRYVVRRSHAWAALAVGAAITTFGGWVAIYEPGKPGARIYFHTQPGVPFIWESALGEPKDLLSRLDDQGFPTAHSEAMGGGGGIGRGYVSLVRWRDRPATRARLATWLREQPEVMSVWIDSTTYGPLGIKP